MRRRKLQRGVVVLNYELEDAGLFSVWCCEMKLDVFGLRVYTLASVKKTLYSELVAADGRRLLFASGGVSRLYTATKKGYRCS